MTIKSNRARFDLYVSIHLFCVPSCFSSALLLICLDETSKVFVRLSFLNVGHIVILRFLLEFDIALVSVFAQFIIFNGTQDGTAGFIRMGAVGETAC